MANFSLETLIYIFTIGTCARWTFAKIKDCVCMPWFLILEFVKEKPVMHVFSCSFKAWLMPESCGQWMLSYYLFEIRRESLHHNFIWSFSNTLVSGHTNSLHDPGCTLYVSFHCPTFATLSCLQILYCFCAMSQYSDTRSNVPAPVSDNDVNQHVARYFNIVNHLYRRREGQWDLGTRSSIFLIGYRGPSMYIVRLLLC